MKCLIIDDDPQITELIQHYSEKCEMIDYCISCNDPLQGIKLLSDSQFDLLFLDYNMPKLNGQDLLDLKRDSSKVIMITSNKEFAVDSYKYIDVEDYLLKPLNYERFYASVQRVQATLNPSSTITPDNEKESFMVRDGNDWVVINYKDIYFIKSESNYCHFQTQTDNVMTLAKLKDLESKLPRYFLRCHRSYIINTKFIKRINLEEIELNDKFIPVSQSYRTDVKRFINENT